MYGESRRAPLALVSTDRLRVRAYELEALAKWTRSNGARSISTPPRRWRSAQSHSPTQDGHRGHRSVLGNIGHSLFGNPSQQEEGVAKTILGVGVAKRKLAEKLVINPERR
jgi:hypothetical protein